MEWRNYKEEASEDGTVRLPSTLPPTPMASLTSPSTSSHSTTHTYHTQLGPVAVATEEVAVLVSNPYGFAVRIDRKVTPSSAGRFTMGATLYYFWVYINQILASIALIFKFTTLSQHLTPRWIVSPVLRENLVIVTPPSRTPFPLHYPLLQQTRIWYAPSTVWTILQNSRVNSVPEVHIYAYPENRKGSKKAKLGDVIFIEQEGYMITGEYGPTPRYEGGREGIIALEGHTIDREMVLLMVPTEYMERPDISAGVITGELEEEELEE